MIYKSIQCLNQPSLDKEERKKKIDEEQQLLHQHLIASCPMLNMLADTAAVMSELLEKAAVGRTNCTLDNETEAECINEAECKKDPISTRYGKNKGIAPKKNAQ